MRWQPYPKYKPSDVAWLGDVPEHWEVKRSDKFVATTKHQIEPEIFKGLEVFHYSIPNVQKWNSGVMENGDDIASAKQVVGEPIALVSKLNPRKATIIIAKPHEDLLTLASTEFVAIAPTMGNLRFLAYLASSELFRQRLDSKVQSVTRSHQRARPEDIYRFWAAWPEPSEQIAIADFLDRETGKIDTLVAKNRTLIERLKEQRSALISRTVTRGLPPDAARAAGLDPHPKLKPSGVEWLGEVPEGWEVRPIKFLVSTPVTDGPHETPEILDKGIPFVSAEAISGGQINFKRIRGYISEEDHRNFSRKYRPEMGDIYIVKSGATTGRVAMVLTNMEFNIWSPLAAIRCNPNSIERHFLYSYLQSKEFQTAIELSWSFGTQQNIGMGVIQNLVVPVPSLKEQTAIADFLDRETAKIDALVAKVEATIERLKEYRSVLITVAVTGKIDVRGVVAATDRGLS